MPDKQHREIMGMLLTIEIALVAIVALLALKG